MDISGDYRDLFKTLNRYKVKYIVVGAYAVVYYTQPRFTKDLDIWIRPDIENANKLYKALREFGVPLKDIQPESFTKSNTIYQIGVAPIRIDIMMTLRGVKFDVAWNNRKRTKYANVLINIIGVKELIKSKKSVKREQDILDLKNLARLSK